MKIDFDAVVQAPFRMQPGLRRLPMPAAAPRQHFTPLAPGSRHQREKMAVLSAFASRALACVPGFDASPALHALAAHLAEEHPRHWAWQAGQATAHHLGVRLDAQGQVHRMASGVFGHGDEIPRCLDQLPAAWRLTGLLLLSFEEDWVLVDGASGTVPYLAVTLPSRWAPQDKVGLGFEAIHARVPDATTLRTAGDSLMRLICGQLRGASSPDNPSSTHGPSDHFERWIWTITGHARLHAHPLAYGDEPWPVERAWFRIERQTILPWPALNQGLFTIQVQTAPLAEVIDSPSRAARLHGALASMSDAVLAYRDLTAMRGPLLDWLARRAA